MNSVRSAMNIAREEVRGIAGGRANARVDGYLLVVLLSALALFGCFFFIGGHFQAVAVAVAVKRPPSRPPRRGSGSPRRWAAPGR